jgi:hypothetical protein
VDAGCSLTGPIDTVEAIIQKQGIMFVKGQDGNMTPMSHEKTYQYLGYNKADMETGPHFAGGIQAFLRPSRYVDTMVYAAYKCALDRYCIVPDGATMTNHRFDQTVLSVLAYAPKTRLPHYTEYVAASRHQLNKDLSLPSFQFIITSRGSLSFYRMLPNIWEALNRTRAKKTT